MPETLGRGLGAEQVVAGVDALPAVGGTPLGDPTQGDSGLMGWLDEPQLVAGGALDAVLLAAWQLRGAGAEEAARAVFAQAAAKLDGAAAPPRASLRRGIFTAAQEAAFLRYLAAHADAEATLRAGKAADRGDRLPVLRALLPLAEAAGDAAYAADLARRIGAAEAARAQLDLVATEPGGLAQASTAGS